MAERGGNSHWCRSAYQQLKSISHLALGMHSLFFDSPGDPARLAELRAAAPQALEALHDLTPAQLDRQPRLVRLSLAVNGAPDLPAYERAAAPLLLANALDAAWEEFRKLDAATVYVRLELTNEDWDRLKVIVVGAHMARDGEIAMQYFESLFREQEGIRLVFAEGVWDEPGELKLLGTHLLDASVGEGFFGDARRMHRDLLSDAMKQILLELKQPASPSGR